MAKKPTAKPQESQSFYQRHRVGLNLLGLTAVGGAAFASVYFTAGTTLPWVVSTAAKVGLDVSFLSAWSVPAASAAVAAAGTGALGVVYGVTSAAVSVVSSVWNFCFGGAKKPAAAQQEAAPKTNPLAQLGGPVAQAEVKPVAPANVVELDAARKAAVAAEKPAADVADADVAAEEEAVVRAMGPGAQ